MAARVLVDAGFVVALLSRRDRLHMWAAATAARFPPPWRTCEAVISEASHLLRTQGRDPLHALLRRRSVILSFDLSREMEPVLRLMEKYGDVPMSVADGCLVRMTETQADPIILTTDADFRIYRRHSRQIVPSVTP